MSETVADGQLLGAHVSAAGGIHRAVERAEAIGCTAMQVFTRNPTQWVSPPLTDERAQAFRDALSTSGIRYVAAHDSYLINLASPDDELRAKSIDAVLDEVDRAELAGIPLVVTHLGAHMGSGVDVGLARLAESLDIVANKRPDAKTRIALETTAGQGTTLGARFEDLRRVMDTVEDSSRLATCLDTCHVHAAGYDLSTVESADAVLREFDSIVGVDTLQLIHVNDAKSAQGSRVDRHEHIGQGLLGPDPFRWLMSSVLLTHVPKVIETPQAEKMHTVNLERLREFVTQA
jgi:deoxyribonuclease IV